MKVIKIAEWGKKAKEGDQDEMLRILRFKRGSIKREAKGDEDCYQTIILKLISGIKNYKF